MPDVVVILENAVFFLFFENSKLKRSHEATNFNLTKVTKPSTF